MPMKCRRWRGLGAWVALASGLAADTGGVWTDISSSLLQRLTNHSTQLAWPGGCSGVTVHRINSTVTIKLVGLGLWQSVDRGANWRRIDGGVISGRDETGWATTTDSDAPGRMASFSLDGNAGWTVNGTRWNAFANLGRNWDFGSIDWAPTAPRTIIAARHETTPPGEVYISSDGGVAWTKLGIRAGAIRDGISMVGALGASTFIYSNGHGILRSTDAGQQWSQVSDSNPQTRIPVRFHGAHYLGTTNGLLVSRDQGASWQRQGSEVSIWQGPFFGRDEREMMVVAPDAIFVTRNGGQDWGKVASLKPKESGFPFTPNWFGCYAWDAAHETIYASAMGNPVYRLEYAAHAKPGPPAGAAMADYFWMDTEAARPVSGLDLGGIADRLRRETPETRIGMIWTAAALDKREYRSGEPIHLFAFVRSAGTPSAFVPKLQDWEMLKIEKLTTSPGGADVARTPAGEWARDHAFFVIGGRYLSSEKSRALHIDVREQFQLEPGEYVLQPTVRLGNSPATPPSAQPPANTALSLPPLHFRIIPEIFHPPANAPSSLLMTMFAEAQKGAARRDAIPNQQRAR